MLFGDLEYPLGHDSQAQYCSFCSQSQLHIVTEKIKAEMSASSSARAFSLWKTSHGTH